MRTTIACLDCGAVMTKMSWRHTRCKPCADKHNRAHDNANKKIERDSDRPAWRLKNRLRMRDWRARNPERASESERRLRDKNRDHIRAAHASYYQANAARIKARRVERQDELRAYWKKWRRANLDRRSAYNQNRRARLAGNGGEHTAEEWNMKLLEFKNRCSYCGAQGRLTKDHAVPIARGGSNDISNLVPACRSCNFQKHDKTAAEFMAWLAA